MNEQPTIFPVRPRHLERLHGASSLANHVSSATGLRAEVVGDFELDDRLGALGAGGRTCSERVRPMRVQNGCGGVDIRDGRDGLEVQCNHLEVAVDLLLAVTAESVTLSPTSIDAAG